MTGTILPASVRTFARCVRLFGFARCFTFHDSKILHGMIGRDGHMNRVTFERTRHYSLVDKKASTS